MEMSVKMVFSMAATGENTSRKPLVRPKGDLFFTQPPLSQLDSPQDTSRPLPPQRTAIVFNLTGGCENSRLGFKYLFHK